MLKGTSVMQIRTSTTTLFAVIVGTLFSFDSVAQPMDPPRLILQVTVDQLRGDLPARYYDRFGDGGFRYLMDEGTWY